MWNIIIWNKYLNVDNKNNTKIETPCYLDFKPIVEGSRKPFPDVLGPDIINKFC